jgi:hypothetical protein
MWPNQLDEHSMSANAVVRARIDERVAAFEADNDDYSALMLKALADRLAEALAEMLHLRVCQCHWGYVEDEDLSNQDLTAEGYQGIGPALVIRPVRTTRKRIFSGDPSDHPIERSGPSIPTPLEGPCPPIPSPTGNTRMTSP